MILTLVSCKKNTEKYSYEYDISYADLFYYQYIEKGFVIDGFQMNAYTVYDKPEDYINMVLPETFLGQPIWAFTARYNRVCPLRHKVESLTINQEITIYSQGFYNMSSLRKVSFMSNVTCNGMPFYYCSKLTSVEFLGKVDSVKGEPIFYNCDSLEEINIPRGEVGSITKDTEKSIKTITLGEECTKPERFKDAVMFGELPKATDINLLGEMEINKNTLSNTKPSRYTFGKRVVFQFASLEEQKVYTKDLKIRITANYQEWKDYQTQMSSNFIWEDNGKDSSYFINCDNEKLRLYFNDSADVSGFNV